MSTRSRSVVDELIFSLEDGIVWVTRPDQSAAWELGDYATVVCMMQDFLAQCDLGERLTDRKLGDGQSRLFPAARRQLKSK